MDVEQSASPQRILDSVNEGVYVTDASRRIIYWSKAAERITGWPAEQIVGKHCYDDVLCHVDKDGHQLCGKEHCPLHRAIMTGSSSTVPIIVLAKTRNGNRVPLQVSVSPLKDVDGQIIGGVENFRDLSGEFADIDRARKIQQLALQVNLPADPRIRFATHYIAHDVIGGDYYAVTALDEDRYGLLLADVMGHGVPAALYTMFLSSIWQSQQHLLGEPARFVQAMNDQLHFLIQEDEPFAVALYCLVDLKARQLRLVGAGNPGPLLIRSDGQREQLEVSGVPLGMLEGMAYDEIMVTVAPGDCILFFTDGAVEATDAAGQQLGIDGLMRILQDVGYPASGPAFEAVETRMLAVSDRIRFDDDVTFVEARFG